MIRSLLWLRMEVLITCHGLLEFKIEIGTAVAETSLPKYIIIICAVKVGHKRRALICIYYIYTVSIYLYEMLGETLYINEKVSYLNHGN